MYGSIIISIFLVCGLDSEPPVGDLIAKLTVLFMVLAFLSYAELEVSKKIAKKKSKSVGTLKDKRKIKTLDMIPKKGRKINGNTLRDSSRIYDSFRYGGGNRRGSL